MAKLAALAFHPTTPHHEAATARAALDARMAQFGVDKWPPRTARPRAASVATAPRVQRAPRQKAAKPIRSTAWQGILHAIEDDLRALGFVVHASTGGVVPTSHTGPRDVTIWTHPSAAGRRGFRVDSSSSASVMDAVESTLRQYLKSVGNMLTENGSRGVVYGWAAAVKTNGRREARTNSRQNRGRGGVRRNMSTMTMAEGVVDRSATDGLRGSRLAAKNKGDVQSAVLSAGHYAKKLGETMYVYRGNSYMTTVWRVSSKRSDYLNRINNTGSFLLSVSPSLVVSRHELTR